MPPKPNNQNPDTTPWLLMILLAIGGPVAAGLILDYLRERRGQRAMLCPSGEKAGTP